jgi:Fe(3+) dicitrate transport protein
VIIRKQNEKLFSIRKLKDIEGTAIYAGKKTIDFINKFDGE